MGETDQHKEIKNRIASKIKEWYSLAITEYPDAGHEDDVIAVVRGKKILFEVIWTPRNADRDLAIIASSSAAVKVAIASPKVLSNDDFVRRYNKARVEMDSNNQRTSELLDGSLFLSNGGYLQGDFRQLIEKLLGQVTGISMVFDPKNSQLLGWYEYEGTKLLRKVARIELWNNEDLPADGVNALLEVLEGPVVPRPAKLHPAYTRNGLPSQIHFESSLGVTRSLTLSSHNILKQR